MLLFVCVILGFLCFAIREQLVRGTDDFQRQELNTSLGVSGVHSGHRFWAVCLLPRGEECLVVTEKDLEGRVGPGSLRGEDAETSASPGHCRCRERARTGKAETRPIMGALCGFELHPGGEGKV